VSGTEKKWDWEIGATTSDWSWNAKDLWQYRYLLFSLVRRNLILNNQQTILGPFWTLLQPLLTLMIYVLVFGKMVGISTGGLPPVLFYFSGIVLWNFFNDSFLENSNTFRDNMYLFSKVYFPRIIIPVSIATTHFFRMIIQLVFLFILIFFYSVVKGFHMPFSLLILAFPLSILMVGSLGLGLGLICSVLTAKYRDLSHIVVIGIRLLMFVTPVIYPMASIKNNFQWIVNLNPLTPFFELFRLSLLGEGTVNLAQIIINSMVIIVVTIIALLFFNKRGNKLMDVV
jgi:lipopolysaccharide transport system permease protein